MVNDETNGVDADAVDGEDPTGNRTLQAGNGQDTSTDVGNDQDEQTPNINNNDEMANNGNFRLTTVGMQQAENYLERSRTVGPDAADQYLLELELSELGMPRGYLPGLVEEYRINTARSGIAVAVLRATYEEIEDRLSLPSNATGDLLRQLLNQHIRASFSSLVNRLVLRHHSIQSSSVTNLEQSMTRQTANMNKLITALTMKTTRTIEDDKSEQARIRKLSTTSLNISKLGEYNKWTQWSHKFLGALLRIGCTKLHKTLVRRVTNNNDLTDVVTDADRALLGCLIEHTDGIAQRICIQQTYHEYSGIRAWREMRKTFHQHNDTGRTQLVTALTQLRATDTDDLGVTFAKYDELCERLCDLDGDMHRYAEQQQVDALKQIVITAPRYQHVLEAWDNGATEHRTAMNLRQRLLASSQQARVVPPAPPVKKVSPKAPPRRGKTKFRGPPKGDCKRCGWPIWDVDSHPLDGSKCTRPEFNFKSALQSRGEWRADKKINFVGRVQQSAADRFILDSGSPPSFAFRKLFDVGTFIESPTEFVGVTGDPFTSIGYGNITLHCYDTDNIARALTFEHVREGPTLILGNRHEREGPWIYDTKNGFLRKVNEINGAIEYSIELEYNGHHEVPTIDPRILFSKPTGHDLVHRRFGHTFAHDPNCPSCKTTRTWTRRHRHGQDTTYGEWLEADPGHRFCVDFKYLPPGSDKPYVLRFIDPVSAYTFDYPIADRQMANIILTTQRFLDKLRSRNVNIEIIHADNEFNADAWKIFLSGRTPPIRFSFGPPNHDRKNPHIERSFRTTFAAFRACVHDMNIDLRYASYIWTALSYVHNRTPRSSSKDGRSPLEILFPQELRPDTSRFRVLGSTVYIGIPPNSRTSVNQVIRKTTGIFLGYDEDSRGYLVLPHGTSSPILSTHVEFDESRPTSTTTSIAQVDIADASDTIRMEPTDHTTHVQPIEIQKHVHRMDDAGTEHEHNHLTYERLRDHFPEFAPYYDPSSPREARTLCKVNDKATKIPWNYKQAMNMDRDRWFPAAQTEILALQHLGTFAVVRKEDVPADLQQKHILPTRHVFSEKTNASGEHVADKDRLVMGGHKAEQGVHYDDKYNPVVVITSLYLMIATAQQRSWSLFQADVKNAYVNASLPAGYRIFTNDIQGYNEICGHLLDRPVDWAAGDLVEIKKSLYGLPSSGRNWYMKLTRTLLKYGITQSLADPCLFYSDAIILAIYVDDILVAAPDRGTFDAFLKFFREHFETKDMGLAHNFLGMVIEQNNDGITLQQRHFLDTLRPMVSTSVSLAEYQSVIGSLNWITRTRPDIAYSVSALAQHNKNPGNTHARRANRVIRYAKSSSWTLKMTNTDITDDTAIHAFVDSDFADDVSRRSRAGFVIFYGRRLIAWKSTLMQTIALSSAEAEYMAMTELDKTVRFIVNVASEMQMKITGVHYYSDAASAIHLAQASFARKTKHIDLRYHYIRQRLQDGAFTLSKIHTSDNPADAFTKELPKIVRDKHYAVLYGLTWPDVAKTTCTSPATTSSQTVSGTTQPSIGNFNSHDDKEPYPTVNFIF